MIWKVRNLPGVWWSISLNNQQKRSGRPYTSVKSVEEILEALEIIADTDSESKAYTVTGGGITSRLNGLSEAEFYARYSEAIEKKFLGRWISKVVVQALPKDEVKRFKDAGVQRLLLHGCIAG